MASRESEEASSDVSRTFGELRGGVGLVDPAPCKRVMNCFEREIGGETERQPAGQEEAVPGTE